MKLLETFYQPITRGLTPNILKDMLPMDITPAAKWFLADARQEYWDYTDDFPCIIPPSPLTWMEFEAPDRIESEEKLVLNNQLKRSGVLCMTYEIDPELRKQALKDDFLLRYMQALDGGSRRKIDWLGDRTWRQKHIMNALQAQVLPRWVTVWNLIAEPITGDTFVAFGLYGMYLDEKGKVIKGLNSVISGLSEEYMRQVTKDEPTFDLFSDMLPFMFALSLTHCKNVTTSQQPLPAPVARKRLERGQPAITFTILDIKPMRQVSQHSAVKGKSEATNALHFVRGHMKTFSAEKPLFGKHTGTYWWHLRAAGDKESGEIQKTYRVHP